MPKAPWTLWLSLGVAGTVVAPAVAQAPPPIDLITIGKVCAGSTSSASAPNARGKYTDANGYEFEFGGGNGPVTVTREGQLLYKIEKFTAADYLTCMKEMAEVLSRPPIPAQKSCAIRENGIEKYNTETDIPMTSPERSGGGSQPEWCNTAISLLRAQNPESALSVVSSSERSRTGCAPFNCPLYTYSCTIHVKSNPTYVYKQSPLCP